MDDRVRIYELARRMNLPNQDVIEALRELGYDIKSHSSTVDAAAVNLLISALGKKKEKNPAKASKKAVPKQPGKAVAQAEPPVVAPPPPKPVTVKPRVLSRYRPITAPVATEGAGEAIADASARQVVVNVPVSSSGSVGAATVIQSSALSPAEPSSSVATPATVVRPQPASLAGAEHVAISTKTLTPTSETTAEQALARTIEKDIKAGSIVGEASSEPPAAKSALGAKIAKDEDSISEPEPIKPEVGEREASMVSGAEEIEGSAADDLNFATPSLGQSIKPLAPAAPAVPIRVAAPSIRATPPRPPKAHRQAPSERHNQKKEDKGRPTAAAAAEATTVLEVPKTINLTASLSVKELADKMSISETEVIKRLFMKGTMRTVNQLVELEVAKDLATEMEYEVSSEVVVSESATSPEAEVLSDADKAALVQRPPVVTIMGHVDHGKTSLLDAIRQTKFLLTDAEAGGITQHIGAYHVEVPHDDGTMRQIVFLDTPGHEAFTAMRARGAKATDIAILVVAADDGVMPQTIEAIDHAKAAGVPIIVAVNKIDKPGAEPTRVMSQLMEHGLVPEDLGGETVCVNVSAKKRTNLDQLLEMILLVADIQDLRANPDRPAQGVIIEAELSRGRGAVATALVENGTLREGDFIVAGTKSGRVRALFDDRGQRVKAAGPSMPVEVLGLDEVPSAGEQFEVVGDGQAVKVLVEKRKNMGADRRHYHVTLESLHDMLSTGEVQELNVIIKADVQGTAEAIADSVRRLSGLEVQVRVLRTASGDISENDVNLAASSNAIIIGFNVQPDQNASKLRELAGVDIRTYNIIYQITDDLEKAVQGLIQPLRTEVYIGSAEIRQVFKFGKNLSIAGCMVTSGKVTRGALARIQRDGKETYDGKVETLKRFKDDAKEVAQGFECGMSFEKFNDLREGDIVNAFVIQETKRDLTRA